MKPLSGKVIAVTGGARGIGAATATALTAAGASVVVGDLDLELAGRRAQEYGGLALRLDVSSQESFAGFLDSVVSEYGGLDGLVNNAGFMVIGRMHDVPLERQLAQVDVNLRGVVYGCYEASARMGRGGTIVNIASLAGRIPTPGTAVYSATKAAVLAFSESLDGELAEQGIRVTAVLPTFTNTELIAGTTPGTMMKPVEPEDVAAAVVEMFVAPKALRVVPRALTFSAANWTMTPARAKPWLRAKFGLDKVFTEPDLAARANYDKRTGG
ncbi:SDR family NAD(P)-dependent oxidoreductase [Nocardioides terrisoli]|uniref:SDR family NAD(P)-dependent oxidoreductase n=1 Tax=Nocardioides terrisoli TaxID=3388267 RepID=UPI00287B5B98|nr:SDR family NAD(P)-dependent oxidoreductase [Nocardioides marmorisolisilvae]